MTERVLNCVVKPRRRVRGHLFESKGLESKWLGGGKFEFRLSDGQKVDGRTVVLVQLLDPWSSQTVLGKVWVCNVHGFLCSRDGEDCELIERIVPVSKWTVVASIGKDVVRIAVYRRSKVPSSRSPMRSYGAGFAVMLLEPIRDQAA